MLTVMLATQLTKLKVYTLIDGNMYIDVLVNDVPIVVGVLCENNNRIVRDTYLDFIGDLIFSDTQGLDDPVYSGLGSRYQLIYLETTDAPLV